MNSKGSKQVENLFLVIDAMGVEMRSFAQTTTHLGLLKGVVAKRFERMQQGLEKLRIESAQQLKASGFEDVTESEDTVFQNARHDLRNRVSPVSLACQGLKRKLGEPAALECLGKIEAKVDQFLDLIDSYGAALKGRMDTLEPDLGQRPYAEGSQGNLDSPSHQHLENSLYYRSLYPGKILVVDDNDDVRRELAESLEDVGHHVTMATGGIEAIAMMNEREFDLVLLDLAMPGFSGFEVLEKLKEKGILKYTPIIVVTGQRGEKEAVECLSLGAEGFLTKPLRFKLLMAEIERSLEKRRLKEREYEQFFPPVVARDLARRPDSAEMKAKQAEVTVLFCDIRAFSSISEKLGPEMTVPWLNDVLETLTLCVLEREGVLVDYTGDEIMAMWGAPRETSEHAALACEAALAMLDTLPQLNERWEEKIERVTEVGIGLNSGSAFVGNVGTQKRLKYGPLGNTVNVASRVQGATSHGKTKLLVTEQTLKGLNENQLKRARMLCDVKVKNIEEPITLYEMAQACRPNWSKLKAEYEKALQQFREQRFPASLATLGNLLQDCPDDGPSLLLTSRVVEAMLSEPESFDPVWELPSK